MELESPRSYLSSSPYDYKNFKIKDREGLTWIAHLDTHPIKKEGETCWTTTVHLKCTAHRDQLSLGGTLDPEKDARLLNLIGHKPIYFQSTKKTFEARTEEQVLRLVYASQKDFQKELHTELHLQQKRDVIGAWVDRWHKFG